MLPTKDEICVLYCHHITSKNKKYIFEIENKDFLRIFVYLSVCTFLFYIVN